jgi:hypothetical protein
MPPSDFGFEIEHLIGDFASQRRNIDIDPQFRGRRAAPGNYSEDAGDLLDAVQKHALGLLRDGERREFLGR